MNGTEQRQHRSVTDSLAARLDAVEATLLAAERAIDRNRTHVLTLADEQRGYVDGYLRQLAQQISALRDRTLWQRLRWLVQGF